MSMKQPRNDDSFWFAVQRSGTIVWFEDDESATSLNETIDISGKVISSGEYGLSGLAIHPDYPTDNRIFVVYNDSSNSNQSNVSSFEIDIETRTASNERILLTLAQPAFNHNGGDMHFGNDGMLYVSFGDGGQGQDPRNALNLENLYGSIIRIDVGGDDYTIPTDNPFNTGQAQCNTGVSAGGNCPEIYAYGFRNPWRFSVDRTTGDIWVADVGAATFEEVNRIEAGANYGWPTYEGTSCFNFGNPGCATDGLSFPITEYGHNSGRAYIIGGHVYRGTENPELYGKFIFSDGATNEVFAVNADADIGTAPEIILDDALNGVFAHALSIDGEFYSMVSGSNATGGAIYKYEGGTRSVTMPNNLSETGCFNTNTKTPAQGVFDYEINSALWSDGAEKTRFFALPDGETISVDGDGDFIFPEDSILIKNFLNGTTLLETRLLVKHDIGWRGYSYEWNDAQTDAVLLNEGKTKDVGDFIHTYPSASDCFTCHLDAANTSLGPETMQFNLTHSELGSNQLDYLNAAGYFTDNVSASQEQQLFALDSSASLDERVRSYLHSNCSGCHRPGGSGAIMDLRFGTALINTNACDVNPREDLGLLDPKRIDPGNADNSVLILRMEALDGNRMPPLASLAEDTVATALVRSWINGLSDCN